MSPTSGTDVAISPKSLRAAIKSLEESIDRQTRMREHLEALLAFQGGTATGKRRGRPAKASTKAKKKVAAKPGKRARGGKTLREAIVAVLKRSKGPLKPGVLRDRVLASGHETTATPQNFYTSVWVAANGTPGVKNTKAGFELRGGGGTKKTAKKK